MNDILLNSKLTTYAYNAVDKLLMPEYLKLHLLHKMILFNNYSNVVFISLKCMAIIAHLTMNALAGAGTLRNLQSQLPQSILYFTLTLFSNASFFNTIQYK